MLHKKNLLSKQLLDYRLLCYTGLRFWLKRNPVMILHIAMLNHNIFYQFIHGYSPFVILDSGKPVNTV